MALAIGLGLLSLLLLGAPWSLVLVGAPAWVPLTIDVLLVVVGAVLALGRWWSRRAKANGLDRALAPTKTGRDVARSDLEIEREEIRREIDQAIATLSRSRLAGGGRAAVLALPWYVLLGAPGSGKSTLIRQAGLAFPSAPSGAHGSEPRDGRGLGSTRRCDVWLGNEAVLLDTSGRWAASDDDAAWTAFLERLQRHRGARALDGVLVAVAMDELVGATESERAALGRRLRTRVEAIATRFGVAIPVYLVVTKCDRLVGFGETFAALDKRERARPWGFTLEETESGATLDDRVHDELDLLVRTLRARTATLVAEERRVAARGLIAELPAHLATLVEPLASLVAQIFVSSVYGATPTLRGVYLTSATQEGRATSTLLAPALRASAIEPRPLDEPTLEPRSYFVHQVLTRIAFADAETAAPSTKAKRRRAVLHFGASALAAGAAAGLTLASAVSWQANRRATDVLAVALGQLPSGVAIADPGTLAPLAAALRSARSDRDDGVPLSLRFGLYGGTRRGDVARARYLSSFGEHVIRPLLASEATELEGWGEAFAADLDREPTSAERARATVLLERQLRFSTPAAPDEPELDARGRARFGRALAEAWCGALARPVADCEPQAILLLGLTSAVDRPRVPTHEIAIRAARLGLGRAPADRAELDALIAAVDGHDYDLTLARMIGTSGRALTSDDRVRGAFTRRGWEDVIRARVEASDVDGHGAWLLGPRSARSAPSRETLIRLYQQAYVEEWTSFLASVRVASPSDATESLALLEDLTRGSPPPLGRLLAAVDDNAHLASAPERRAGTADVGLLASLTTRLGAPDGTELATSSAPPPAADPVARALAPYTRFAVRGDDAPEDAPLGVDEYGDELALLRDALATYRDDPTVAAALETRLVAARRRVDGLVAEQEPGTRDFFERVLRPPVEAAAVTSSRAMAGAVANAFCSAIVTPFSASLAGRYPFTALGDDAPLGELAAFYAPTGTLWSYYDASLATIAPREGSRFVLARRLDHGASPYSSALPAFLARSRTITDGFFPPGSSDPRIELDVRIHPTPGAASVRFAVGGASIDYRNGPETWTRVVWPGTSPSAGARLEVESARGLSERLAEEGEWGLFRLVEAAVQVDSRPGERTHTVRWHLPGHEVDVVVDLRSVRTECPLFGEGRARALAPLRASGVAAPRRITRAGSECAR